MNRKSLGVLKDANFQILFFSKTVYSIAGWALVFAAIDWIEKKTGSGLIGDSIFGMKLIITVIEIFSGTFADRMNRRLLMVFSGVSSGCLTLLLIVINNPNTIIMFSVVLAVTLISTFYSAASTAIIPQSINPHDLLTANLFFSISLIATLVFSKSLTGTLIHFLNHKAVFTISAILMISGGLLILLLKETKESVFKQKKKIIKELFDGVSYCVRTKKLKGIIAAILPIAVGVGPLIVLLPRLVNKIDLGTLISVNIYLFIGIGVLFGFIFLQLFGNHLKLGTLLAVGLTLSGGSIIFLSTASNFISTIIPITVAGAGMIVIYSTVMTSIHLLIQDEYMGRVTMTIFGTGSFVGGLSSFVFGLLSHIFGIRFAIALAGTFVMIGLTILLKYLDDTVKNSKVSNLLKLKNI